MEKLSLEDFLFRQISNKPNIAFGEIFADVCIQSSKLINQHEKDTFGSIKNALDNLERNDIITSEHRDNNTFYNLSKKEEREKTLKKLGIL